MMKRSEGFILIANSTEIFDRRVPSLVTDPRCRERGCSFRYAPQPSVCRIGVRFNWAFDRRSYMALRLYGHN